MKKRRYIECFRWWFCATMGKKTTLLSVLEAKVMLCSKMLSFPSNYRGHWCPVTFCELKLVGLQPITPYFADAFIVISVKTSNNWFHFLLLMWGVGGGVWNGVWKRGFMSAGSLSHGQIKLKLKQLDPGGRVRRLSVPITAEPWAFHSSSPWATFY